MLINREKAKEPHDYTHPSTADHAESDLNYVSGLEAHLDEGGAASARNVRDLIAMVRWNATGLLKTLSALPTVSVTDEMDALQAENAELNTALAEQARVIDLWSAQLDTILEELKGRK